MQENNFMGEHYRLRSTLAGLAIACSLLACGGGGSDAAPAAVSSVAAAQDPGAPALVNNVATDGFNWINFRRSQIGLPALARNSLIDLAAQGHSDYQKINDTVTHEQTAGKPGFTGVGLFDRLKAAGYLFANADYAYGEVISATSNNTGFYMAEELITAIYHRFVIFEPMFKEIGTGAAATPAGYIYFTSDFTANNGYGPGVGRGNIVTWPYNGQTRVTPNFFSDFESPDPVAGVNEVGYPISVHADINTIMTVQSFTLRPHGGAELPVKLLKPRDNVEIPDSAAAIIPLSVLKAGTTYDVTFSGTVDAVPVSKNWSFTTK
jgi:uncharacterized protein YkwD